MCGRFLLDTTSDDREVCRFTALAEARFPEEIWSRGEVLPGSRYPVLVRGGEKAAMQLMTWGIPGVSGTIINARAETVWQKSMFAASARERRCAILASGFFEWGKDSAHTKFLFSQPGGAMYLAGIWVESPEGPRFAILTTAANASVSGVHHRMPVILRRGEVLTWLNDEHAARVLMQGRMPCLTAESEQDSPASWNYQ